MMHLHRNMKEYSRYKKNVNTHTHTHTHTHTYIYICCAIVALDNKKSYFAIRGSV